MTVTRYFVDTGVAIHRPQTDRLRGRTQGRCVHGYFGSVLTLQQALASDVPLCDRCFPQGFSPEIETTAVGARAARLRSEAAA